jgi:RNA polymerase sigma-70 factor (ECF subfamily)
MLLGNPADAEDALQEVFVRAMRAVDAFRGESSPMTWLYRISTNHCLNVLRANRRRRTGMEKRAADASFNSYAPPESIEDLAAIREILPAFDREIQALAVMYFLDGMSQQEVADEIGLSVPTVRKRLNQFIQRAKKRLK